MSNRRATLARLAGTIVTVAVALGGIGLAGPGQAADHEKSKTERVIVLTKDGKAGDGEHRRVRIIGPEGDHPRIHVIHPDGGDHHVRVIERGGGERHVRIIGPEGLRNCDGDSSSIDESSDEGRQRTRIMVCSRGGDASAAERLERLVEVKERIGAENELSAEHKERVIAALEAEIARLRRSE